MSRCFPGTLSSPAETPRRLPKADTRRQTGASAAEMMTRHFRRRHHAAAAFIEADSAEYYRLPGRPHLRRRARGRRQIEPPTPPRRRVTCRVGQPGRRRHARMPSRRRSRRLCRPSCVRHLPQRTLKCCRWPAPRIFSASLRGHQAIRRVA